MLRLIYGLFVFSAALLFVFDRELLDLLGWQFSSDSGPFLTKIHPATYILGFTTALAFVARPFALIRYMSTPAFLFFVFASFIMLVRSFFIFASGAAGGEVGAILTNFFTPAFILLCASCFRVEDLTRLELPVRIFLVLNSAVAVLERLFSHRLIPNELDKTMDMRSTAFVHHPLNGSLITGLIIVYLATVIRSGKTTQMRIGELAIHGAAMFAFGGRSALIFTAIVLILSSVTRGQRVGEAGMTLFQRSLPFMLIVLGVGLVFLPIDFIDATLDRFTNDLNSAESRNSAVVMLMSLNTEQLLFGMDIYDRVRLVEFYDAMAIELAWIALTITYGFLATLPMMIALPWLTYTVARTLDRSALYMGLLFMIVTVGSLSIGVKSLLVCQFFLIILILCQRQRISMTHMLRPEAARAERGHASD